MHCPNCNDAMESVAHTSHMGTRVEIDVCGPCHVIWFDSMESASLSPGSVIELFKRIHAARGGARNTIKTVIGCPLCATTLNSVTDLAKGGRFTYLRCVSGHGRLTSYVQFLREKNFIRSLQPHEIAALSVKIKQIRCSSCGGPISLESDKACTHCGAAISVLDEAAVEKALVALKAKFPPGLTYSTPYDTTPFVSESIKEVLKTLAEAMVLVFIVVYLFLQSWRATIIPTLAVPVSLIGTMAGLHLLGYSINTLTLFGMVLAIGIVVDDAIVVLENVERLMAEEGMGPRDAAIEAMNEVTGPVVAIVLVLCAAFVPIAFLGGLAGELYRQFSVTISIAVVLSGLVAAIAGGLKFGLVGWENGNAAGSSLHT